jgi:hypothetical protein
LINFVISFPTKAHSLTVTSKRLSPMRYSLLFIAIHLSLTSYCQIANNTNRCNNKNIYLESLIQYVQHYHPRKQPANPGKVDTIFVALDNDISDSLLSKIQEKLIVIVEQSDPYQPLRTRDGRDIALPITLYQIYHLEYNEGEFQVEIKESKLELVNPGRPSILVTRPNDKRTVAFTFKEGEFHFIRVD